MKNIKIDDALLNICPKIQLGCIQYTADVEKGSKELWNEISNHIKDIEKNMTLDDISKEKNISDSRELYKRIGKDPYRYRISSEALIRRILQGKGLYKINNVVDANNLISIISKLSVGSYDIDRLGQELTFRIGKKGESYKGIGKDIINTENLPVFSDEFGAYGSPTSDSEKAMINSDSKNILTVLIAFSDDANLEHYMKKAVEILENYVGAKNIDTYISKGDNQKDEIDTDIER